MICSAEWKPCAVGACRKGGRRGHRDVLDDVRLDEQLPGLGEQVTLLEEGRTSLAFDCTGLLD